MKSPFGERLHPLDALWYTFANLFEREVSVMTEPIRYCPKGACYVTVFTCSVVKSHTGFSPMVKWTLRLPPARLSRNPDFEGM